GGTPGGVGACPPAAGRPHDGIAGLGAGPRSGGSRPVGAGLSVPVVAGRCRSVPVRGRVAVAGRGGRGGGGGVGLPVVERTGVDAQPHGDRVVFVGHRDGGDGQPVRDGAERLLHHAAHRVHRRRRGVVHVQADG